MPDQSPNTDESCQRARSLDTPKDVAAGRHRRGWRWVLAGLIPTLLAIGLLLRPRHPQEQVARSKSAVNAPTLMIGTATAQMGDIGVYVGALGVVTPLNTVAVRSRVDGQLVQVHYLEGQTVHQGDALVDIDGAPFQATLAQ